MSYMEGSASSHLTASMTPQPPPFVFSDPRARAQLHPILVSCRCFFLKQNGDWWEVPPPPRVGLLKPEGTPSPPQGVCLFQTAAFFFPAPEATKFQLLEGGRGFQGCQMRQMDENGLENGFQDKFEVKQFFSTVGSIFVGGHFCSFDVSIPSFTQVRLSSSRETNVRI